MNTTDFKKQILGKLNEILKPRRFKKKQNIFSYSTNDLTYYICLRNAVVSTDTVLKTTITIEIASLKICQLKDLSIPGYLHRHFIKNIGDYSSPDQCKWWTIDNEESSRIAETEIEYSIIKNVLPEIDSLRTANDLARLWESQIFPGITQYQRDEYLSILRALK